MTYEEAIERLKKRICQEGAHREDKTYHFCTDECMYGEEECEVAIAIKALEKQIPKKPVFEKDRYGTNHFYCPSCKEMLIGTFHHCDCGQKLWWSE